MLTYDVKVRGDAEIYLWGGDRLRRNSELPLLLTIQVDEDGEEIVFGTESTQRDSRLTVGGLLPRQTYSLSLMGLRGVFCRCASKDVDATVHCTVTLRDER